MLNASIVNRLPNGDLVIRPETEEDHAEADLMIRKKKLKLDIRAFDINKLTRVQQQKAHALIHDINDYGNNDIYFVAEENLKYKFLINMGFPTDKIFSLADCSKDMAMLFISWLVEYCFYFDIPFRNKNLHQTFDMNRKLFLDAVHKRCFATESMAKDTPLHIHHINAIQTNRKKADHRGRYFMILKAELHQEIHMTGYKRFCEKWHTGAIQLSEEQIINLGLMSKTQMDELDSEDNREIRSFQLPE